MQRSGVMHAADGAWCTFDDGLEAQEAALLLLDFGLDVSLKPRTVYNPFSDVPGTEWRVTVTR